MNSFIKTSLIVACFALGFAGTCHAQLEVLDIREGTGIPSEVRAIYEKGADYLASTQLEDGNWETGQETRECGICGLCVMAFLSTGEDPNFGKYSQNIRKALQFIIRKQDKSGYIPGNMYSHGFAMLALAEAYGAVDDERFWAGEEKEGVRTIGESLELAVRMALTSQKNNPRKAWRYAPTAQDADTSVAGAVIMGLLAAQNAGIEVPDASIDAALAYMKSLTTPSGEVGYTGPMGRSWARSAIACLVFSIGKHKDWEQYESTKKFITNNFQETGNWPFYTRYYQAQALFQSDYETWELWNADTIKTIQNIQKENGEIPGSAHGVAYSTSMSLLALALNYRFLPIYER